MKKVLLILILLVNVTACYNTIPMEMNSLQPGYFQDVCQLDDNTTYYMSCNVTHREAEIYFARKERAVIGVKEILIDGSVRYMDKDTAFVTVEDYRYTPDQFKLVLIKKSLIPRDTSVFKFTNNMYCSWGVFDEIYETYVK